MRVFPKPEPQWARDGQRRYAIAEMHRQRLDVAGATYSGGRRGLEGSSSPLPARPMGLSSTSHGRDVISHVDERFIEAVGEVTLCTHTLLILVLTIKGALQIESELANFKAAQRRREEFGLLTDKDKQVAEVEKTTRLSRLVCLVSHTTSPF